jgi:hypothetical protein
MQENVGGADRVFRAIAGPGLMVAGLTMLGARKGRVPGLTALVGGALLGETAITKVCPLNAAIGIDISGRSDGEQEQPLEWLVSEFAEE